MSSDHNTTISKIKFFVWFEIYLMSNLFVYKIFKYSIFSVIFSILFYPVLFLLQFSIFWILISFWFSYVPTSFPFIIALAYSSALIIILKVLFFFSFWKNRKKTKWGNYDVKLKLSLDPGRMFFFWVNDSNILFVY